MKKGWETMACCKPLDLFNVDCKFGDMLTSTRKPTGHQDEVTVWPFPEGTGLKAYKSRFYLDTDNQSSVAVLSEHTKNTGRLLPKPVSSSSKLMRCAR